MRPLDFWLPQLNSDVILRNPMTLQPISGSPSRHPLPAKTLCPWPLLQKGGCGGEVGIRREEGFASVSAMIVILEMEKRGSLSPGVR